MKSRTGREHLLILALATAVASCLAGPPALASGVAIVTTQLTDNGDHDGFADTRETVELRLLVRNSSGIDLGDLTAQATADGALACLTEPSIDIGDLAAGEERWTEDAFVFTVADVDRADLGLGPFDALSLELGVSFTAGAQEPPALPSTITLDLDLDVSGGAGTTTFFESFENGLGAFEIQNLDQGRYGLEASDGYRCQDRDPDWVNSLPYQYPDPVVGETCFLGLTPLQTDAVFWGMSGPETSPQGGRGFSGFHSLFFGIDLGPPRNWTTPLQTLEAAATVDPIRLAWEGDSPSLSFKHQVRFVENWYFNPGHALDRGVVMVQVADGAGNGVGPWLKVHPYQNTYDTPTIDDIPGCIFDPIDDGNTEDDFFDPQDPLRVYGPSSTCYPGRVFANTGETSNPFNSDAVGAGDGPGLQGVWGIGTWVESKVDLGRFRGRQIRVRFLATAIKSVANDWDWEQLQDWNPVADDDGWWIDDVTVSGAMVSAATVVIDSKDNSALPAPRGDDLDGDGVLEVCDNCNGLANENQDDVDLDGVGNACDCNNILGEVFPGSDEINDGIDNQCPGDAGYGVVDEVTGLSGFFNPDLRHEYSWTPQSGASVYEVARADSADFSSGCVLFPSLHQNFVVDLALPESAGVFHYLVRAVTPNEGSWGQGSVGQERTVPCESE